MNLADVELQERLMTVHLLSSDYGGQTGCWLDASTVHWTCDTVAFDCPACARAFLDRACWDDDPANCGAEAHRRAARLAYPPLALVEGGVKWSFAYQHFHEQKTEGEKA